MKNNVFTQLGVLMMGFGVIIGIVFPFFITLLGVPSTYTLTPTFFFVSMSAGLFVGAINIILAKNTVQKRMTLLATKMSKVEQLVKLREQESQSETCDPASCLVKLSSNDAIGEAAKAFNTLVLSLIQTFQKDDALSQFNQAISTKLELSDLAPKALEAIMHHAHADAGALLVEQHGELVVLTHQNLHNVSSLTKHDRILEVFESTQSQRIKLPKDIDMDGLIATFKPRCVLIIPIVYKQVSMGVLVLASVYDFSHEHEKNIGYFMTGLSLALKNATTHSQLQELAANDPLTHVFNRRFGLMRLQEEYSRAIRTDSPFGLLMLDIDFFKKFNDTYGHLLGDRVLIQVSNMIKKAVREGDVVMRYGGEEFMVILPGASLNDTAEIAEKIRHRIEQTPIHHQGAALSVTVSVGYTSYPHSAIESVSSMIDLADQALYQAKEQGRNMIVAQ